MALPLDRACGSTRLRLCGMDRGRGAFGRIKDRFRYSLRTHETRTRFTPTGPATSGVLDDIKVGSSTATTNLPADLLR
ncbi:hypothetical protein BDN71DRAFT_1585491 [Pleurotus eryngii]|uniref:Uncharacterized protein n=1 Tax=Pleurotus eryngii TaxID=5323 RepID=A0A9P6A7E5_PLEER|nr:hypothetical protein BDN71DRAFT_1585491 [Pleurotus eryngii]